MADSPVATRGDLAYALWKALGLTEPTSTGKFSDAGYLDGITSTLADLGITNGIGGGKYGTTRPLTRGEAFTMIARALGLADANTSIPEASQALVDAGIVKGYGNDPNNLGINDPLQKNHLDLLLNRMQTDLARPDATSGQTGYEKIQQAADETRDLNNARQNPSYAAFLQAQGARLGEINDEIALRQELFSEDARRRSEAYRLATEQAIKGVRTDWENRGLFRSGARLGRESETRDNIARQQEREQYAAQRQHESGLRSLEQERNAIQRAIDQARIQAGATAAQDQIQNAT